MTETISPDPNSTLLEYFSKQRRAFRAAPYADSVERRRRLALLKQLLVDNQTELCAAIDRDFNGRSVVETQIAEFLPTIMAIDDATRHLKAWMRAQRKWLPLLFQPASAEILPQPLGVIGIIAPWNYPLLLTLGPLIGALAAGNHVLIKPSELSPEFGRLLARLIDQYFDAGLVAVVNGDVALAQNFSALPFQHLVFTGSVEVGRAVMRAASDNLTPVTLELGGKSPVVIARSMPVREAAERLVFAKCLNAGQTCVAPDYILCPDDQVSDFVQHFLSEAKRQYGDITQNDDYTAIINQAQRKRLIAYVDEAKAAGALVFVAGPSDELDYYGNKLPPILLTNVPEGSRLLEDEIFGPLLPIIKYHSLDEALNYINDRPQPLALYVFGYEQQLRPLFSRKTHSGALMFNEAVIHVGMPNLPFGGVGNSGMGHYHGRYGFETFSKLKPIIVKQRLSSLKLLYPPYKSWLVNLILRVFGR